ncbi:MAG: hypothetical protein ACI85O_000246 [Saprospiraceae bacterium]|jgi:hypothetical protein
MKKYFSEIYFSLILIFATSCAQIVAPTGGPKDEDPPILDTLNSTPNFQTNFTKQELEFQFDEWVQLKDVFNQVVTSPPLRYGPPEVYLRKKSVRLKFDEREELKENATYVINFGDAIRDLSENNPTELRFVFSTGDFIDSLSIGGKVLDSFTAEPVEDIIVMLYDNLSDTVVRTERPFYFAKTDKTGKFKIENLRADTFKIFALKDTNLDYLYNSEAEQIGFSDSLLIVNDSLQPNNLRISAFLPTPKLTLQDDVQDKYGLLRMAFSQSAEAAKIDYIDFGQKVYQEVKEDSLLLWYDDPSGGLWEFYLDGGDRVDTIEIGGFPKEAFMLSDTFFLENKKFGNQKVNPKKQAKLTFNHPVDSIDMQRIIFTEDTLKTKVKGFFTIDTQEKRTVNLTYKWKETMPYELTVLPEAFTDLYGFKNKDTIQIKYQTTDLKEFGNINLTVDSLDSDLNYVFELMLKDNVIETLKNSGEPTFQHNFIALPPGNYTLRIVEDTDGNGKWSPGNYDLKTQSERVFEKKIEEVRANWDVDAVLEIE